MLNCYEITRLHAPLVLKKAESEGAFCGYASVFNQLDTQGDRVLKGAFTESLKTWTRQGRYPKMLWQHNQTEPLGYWKMIREDEKGLYVEGQLLLEVAKAREAYALLKSQILDGLSIGCQIVEAQKGAHPNERLLSQVTLFEISLVTFAANPEAKILQVKDQSPYDAWIPNLQRLIDLLTH